MAQVQPVSAPSVAVPSVETPNVSASASEPKKETKRKRRVTRIKAPSEGWPTADSPEGFDFYRHAWPLEERYSDPLDFWLWSKAQCSIIISKCDEKIRELKALGTSDDRSEAAKARQNMEDMLRDFATHSPAVRAANLAISPAFAAVYAEVDKRAGVEEEDTDED